MNYTLSFTLDVARRVASGAFSNEEKYALASAEDTEERSPKLLPYRMVQIFFAEEWLKCGLPHVEAGHALAASLMATSVPADELVGLVVPPWRAFVISIPDKLLPIPSGRGRESWARALLVETVERTPSGTNWQWLLASDEKDNFVWPSWTTTESMVKGTELMGSDWNNGRKNAKEMRRLGKAVARLIVGTCIRMSDPRHFVHAGKPKNGSGKRDGRDSPIPTRFDTYRLIGDVKVDVRKAVAEYVRHGGKSPTVQSMVRGHWKHQTHGPGGTKRKLIHVEPYWRGPEDAPIAIRSHVVEADA